MARRSALNPWLHVMQRTWKGVAAAQRTLGRQALKATLKSPVPRSRQGDWVSGIAIHTAGMRRYRLFKPPGVGFGERLPLVVMLHGCGQDAGSFAASTRMANVAARERFYVLFVEQERTANLQGCWNWYDTRGGRAHAETSLVMAAIDQVQLLYPIDRSRVAIAGLSAGASMAALVASRHPTRFCAVAMHSGVPPGTAHSSASALSAMRGRRRAAALPPATVEAWPPLLVLHGRADRIVSDDNARLAAAQWAAATGARPTAPRALQRGQRHGMTVTDHVLRGRTLARLCEIDTLGHAWSGGSAAHPYGDPKGPDASRLLWRFVAQQFGRAAPAANRFVATR